MNEVAQLLDRLQAADIRVSLDGEHLAISAPKGALTPALRDELKSRKDDLLAHLKSLERAIASAARTVAPEPLYRIPRTADMPISHTQQRLWFMRQLDPESSVYNVAAPIRFKGNLDVNGLQSTMNKLVEHHESLRTSFRVVDGAPVCSVAAQLSVTIEHMDVTHVPAEEREEAALAAAKAFAVRPFDLRTAPLMRVGLVRKQSDEFLFEIVLDHIVADGLSLGVLLFDFLTLYSRYVAGSNEPLAPLPVQYIDYADWERRSFENGALALHKAYWKKHLASLPSLLQLPTDRPRPPVQTSNGSRGTLQISADNSRRIKAFAREERTSLFMVLIAAFQVLLYRHSGETDIAIGSAVGNRDRADVERVVGFFANSVVLRNDLSGNPTVREFLARVRDVSLSAYAHQAMPFDMLVDELITRRELGHAPLFQVMFVLQNLNLVGFDLPGLRCDPVELPTTTARFDIAVDVFDLEVGLRAYAEYNADLFDAETINAMLEHYERILNEFIANPNARISELRILSDNERNEVERVSQGPVFDVEPSRTLHRMVEEQAERTPDALAVQFGDTSLSYRQLNERANQLAHRLRELNMPADALVGVWMDRSLEMVVAMLGVLKAGAAYVPIDPAFPRDRIEFMMSDAELAALVTQSRLSDTLGTTPFVVVRMDADAPSLALQPTHNPSPVTTGSSLAYVIYTSGSTGRPKGVEVEHTNVVNFLLAMQSRPGFASHDTLLAVTTLSFDIAGLELWLPLSVGARIVVATRTDVIDGERLAAMLRENNVTVMQATPATWRLLFDSGWTGKSDLKVLCGGEALPRDLATTLNACVREVWNMYGPTETTIWSTAELVQHPAQGISIGTPIGNTRVLIVEPSGQLAPVGVPGELCIGGLGVARGYRNRPELTAEKFSNLTMPDGTSQRVYRTGDLARFKHNGLLEFIGRRDNQVKVRGYRIELGEIETVLSNVAAVKECAVVVRGNSSEEKILAAYVVTVDGAQLDEESTRATLREKLPEYMMPNVFVVLPSLPLTPNAKIDRAALPAPVMNSANALAATNTLMTADQARVATIWREVLRIGHVGLHDNFFDRGGHSLLLVRLHAALKREFKTEIALVELFQRTTVASQTERLSSTTIDTGAVQRAQARAARLANG